jgi:hypothetical protein
MAGTFEHVVRWWLNDPADAKAADGFLAVVRGLEGVPGILAVRAGRSFEPGWEGPDQSWDLGFVASFADFDAVRGYMEHPAHAALVALGERVARRFDVFYLETA